MSPPLPEGFCRERTGRGTLIAHGSCLAELKRRGLADVPGWEALLTGGKPRGGGGRGATAVLDLDSGARLFVKQLRRGGLAGGLWHDRFPGTGRLLANVCTPHAVAERGIRTPAPLALMLFEGPPGLHRAWIAFEEVPDARTLLDTLVAAGPRQQEALAPALRFVRGMHDAGLEHPDLNLANLLLTPGGGSAEIWVIDLDGARLHDGPLPFRLRQRALRRLERSYVKNLGGTAAPLPADAWYRLYAAGDEPLSRRLHRGRPAGRVRLWFHRLGWRR